MNHHDASSLVSVVIIGRNEGERLRRCLDSVRTMDYPAELIEILYVDSNSTDGSVALAHSMGVRTIVLDGPTTAARGRNAGWTAARGSVVLFLDGDTVLYPGFVRIALAAMDSTDSTDSTDSPMIAGVFGARRESDAAGSLYNAIFDLDWESAPGETLYFGGDALVRVEALRAVSGYNASLIAGEEPDMCRRMRGLGYRIVRIDAPMTMHDLDMHRFGQYWRRSVRTGYAYAEVSSFYGRTADPLWQSDSRGNLLRGLFWIGGAPIACVAAVLTSSILPVLALVGTAMLMVARRAWAVRGRVPNGRQLLAYSVHSHLQHIPILLGQARFWLFGRGRFKARLMEYKTTP